MRRRRSSERKKPISQVWGSPAARTYVCTLPYVSFYYLQDTLLKKKVQVSKEKKGRAVDARCRDLTCTSACEKGRANPGSVPLCDWHEVRVSKSRRRPRAKICSPFWSGIERPRTWAFGPIRHLDPCGHNGAWQSKQDLPLLYYPSNGSVPDFREGTAS